MRRRSIAPPCPAETLQYLHSAGGDREGRGDDRTAEAAGGGAEPAAQALEM